MSVRGIVAVLVVTVTSSLGMGCGSTREGSRQTTRTHTTQPSADIPISQLRSAEVIGDLGIPLGTVAEIRATVFAGRELRLKRYASVYLLRVTSVNGRKLEHPVLIEFRAGSEWTELPLVHNSFELYEMKKGVKASSLDDDEEQQLEKDYVGREFRLIVYETGRFDGLPDAQALMMASHGFSFSNYLIVLRKAGR